MKKLTINEVARMGGMSTKNKLGSEHYKKIQKSSVKKRKQNKKLKSSGK